MRELELAPTDRCNPGRPPREQRTERRLLFLRLQVRCNTSRRIGEKRRQAPSAKLHLTRILASCLLVLVEQFALGVAQGNTGCSSSTPAAFPSRERDQREERRGLQAEGDTRGEGGKSRSPITRESAVAL